MMRILLLSLFISIVLLSSCVSSSTYDAMVFSRDSLQVLHDSLVNVVNDKEKIISQLHLEADAMRNTITELRKQLEITKENYQGLKSKTSTTEQEYLAKIENLQSNLYDKNQQLMLLENEVKDYKGKLQAREESMKSLRNKLQKALLGFEDKGMTVSVMNGKVYVSLSNQLLFSSGSTDIDDQGKEALIELAKVLNENPDINILVEGHTDNQSVRPGAKFKDNWDLSVLRSTEVVRFLVNEGKVEPTRIIASGRGEFFPIKKGDDPESRAFNRRTEIILTPKLEEIFEIIKEK